MTKVKKIFLGVCFILISTTFIYSQNYGLPKIINFENNEQEFSREQVWQIKESSNGFLYFASSKYFLEYDRNNWRIIKKTVSNPIFSFDIDSNNFYLGLKKGIYFGQLNSSSFSFNQIKLSTRIYNVWKTFRLKNQTYFFFNKKNALVLKNNTLEFIRRPSNFEITRAFKVDNTIYAVSKKGIAKIDDNKLIIISHNRDKIYQDDIRTIIDFDKKNLLIGTFKGSLWLMNKKTYEIKKFQTNLDALISKSTIYYGVKYNDSSFILSTLNNGIFIISNRGIVINHYTKNEGLPSNSVYYVYVDKCKNIWLGTGNGVSYIKYNSPIFFYDKRKQLNEKINFTHISSNTLITGTYANILGSNLTNESAFKQISPLQYSNSFIQRKINNKKYFVIGGYYRIEVLDSKFNIISKTTSSNKNIITPSPFDSSKFFIATYNELALWKITKRNNKIELVKEKQLIETPIIISKIFVDKYNDLWIATEEKIICIDYNRKGDSFEKIYFDKKECEIDKKTLSIFETNGRIYFSEDDKLMFIKNSAEKKNLKLECNDPAINKILSSSKIYDWTKDNKNIYFASNLGIISSSFDLKQIKYIKIKSYFDKYQTNISNYNEYLFVNDISSIYSIKKSLKPNYICKLDEKTLLRSIKISNRKKHYFYNKKDSIVEITDNTYNIQKVFNSKENFIFEFYTSIISPNNAKFFYKIENDNNRWESLENNKLTFRHLKSGKYTVKVKSTSNNRELEELTIIFKVKPPFYLSIYAILLYTILLSLIILSSIKYSVKMIKKQKKKLEITVKRRTEQLEEKNEEIISQSRLLKQQKQILEKESNKLKLAMIEMQQLSLVAQKTDNSVLIIDKNGKFEWWNHGFIDLFRYKLEKFKNLPLKNSYQKIRPDIIKEIRSYSIDKGTITYTNHEMYENGEEIWYQTTINPIIDNEDDAKLVKFVIIDINISEKKNSELIIQNQNEINKLLKNKHNKTKSDLELKEELLKKYQNYNKSNIKYTKLLQHSFSNSNNEILSLFKDYFILNMPKDILSGDFLFLEKISEEETVIIFGDASGHRVKGSISSIIAQSTIKEIILKSPKSDVNEILNTFNKKINLILSTFNHENNINYNIAALKINNTKQEITFSSSRISLFLLRPASNYNYYRFNANKFNIDSNLTRKFDIEKIKFLKGDRFYLATDGWANQFGKLGIKKYTNRGIRDFLLTIQDFNLVSQKTQIQAEIKKWKGSFYQLDDILVLGFEIK